MNAIVLFSKELVYIFVCIPNMWKNVQKLLFLGKVTVIWVGFYLGLFFSKDIIIKLQKIYILKHVGACNLEMVSA